MSLRLLQKNALTRAMLVRLAAPRAAETVGHFAAYLQPGERIVDVGSGICDITRLLMQAGHHVTPLDIQNLSFFSATTPVLYDGWTMPFADKQFDIALILTVLHHTRNPEEVVREAVRVAKRVIIIEDVYYNTPHKYATYLIDSLLNLEFIGHPHSNKTEAEWLALFEGLGLEITHQKAMQSFGVLRHRMYILEPRTDF